MESVRLATHQGPVRVLVLCPSFLDRVECKKIGLNNGRNDDALFEFYYLDDYFESHPVLSFAYQFIQLQADNNDLLTYIEKAAKCVSDKKITAVISTSDTGSLLVAAVCAKTGLRGPSFESAFLCMHKYYSRRAEPTKLWSEYISLEPGTPQNLDMVRYPCYLKPPAFSGSVGQFTIRNRASLDKALEVQQSMTCLSAFCNMWKPAFSKYLNLQKYHLATSNITIVEELVEGASQYCIEGWMDNDGEYHPWSVTDYQHYRHPQAALFGYFNPSSEPPEVIAKLHSFVAVIAKNHKLRNTFFNVEVWRQGDRLDVTEVNGRCALVWYSLYKGVYNVSLHKAVIYVAMGQFDKAKEESPLAQAIPSRVGGQFNIYTFGKGKASEFFNFPLAHTIGETEEVYDTNGDRGIDILVDQDTWIAPENSSTTGSFLARFLLFGRNRKEISERAMNIIDQLQLQPHLAPVM